MIWTVVWTRQAKTELRRLDVSVAQRVFAAVLRLTETGQGDVKKLIGEGDQFRLRVGDWRVRFTLEEATQTMTVLHVLPRGRAYRD